MMLSAGSWNSLPESKINLELLYQVIISWNHLNTTSQRKLIIHISHAQSWIVCQKYILLREYLTCILSFGVFVILSGEKQGQILYVTTLLIDMWSYAPLCFFQPAFQQTDTPTCRPLPHPLSSTNTHLLWAPSGRREEVLCWGIYDTNLSKSVSSYTLLSKAMSPAEQVCILALVLYHPPWYYKMT